MKTIPQLIMPMHVYKNKFGPVMVVYFHKTIKQNLAHNYLVKLLSSRFQLQKFRTLICRPIFYILYSFSKFLGVRPWSGKNPSRVYVKRINN